VTRRILMFEHIDMIVDRNRIFYRLRVILTTTQHNNTTRLKRFTIKDKSNNHNNIILKRCGNANSKSLRYETTQYHAYNKRMQHVSPSNIVSKRFRYFTIKII